MQVVYHENIYLHFISYSYQIVNMRQIKVILEQFKTVVQ